MSNVSLNTAVALRIGPLLLDTLFKHYLERKTVTKDSKAREELLYDAAFTAFRAFMDAATKHSVEELQQFSNVRIPAPPWVHLIRLRIPLSSCNDAAQYLILALGGEDRTRTFVGGVKWWQTRGLQGIEAQWVCSKKDLEREERVLREKRREATLGPKSTGSGSGGVGVGAGAEGEKPRNAGASGNGVPEGEGEPVYSSGMDSMRCLLYLHGGGYYFGSVDQERYMMQRFARKMKGRCFAVDYRLAPQYPFPCALQDCIAAYLYLIRPPPGASHAPIPPNRIIFGGDSAGGGLVLSLLQIIRDTGLPLPGGAVLISPWCDLTHSFPSIFENTATDIVPTYGLSIHKPSTLWPPPPEDLSSTVRSRLRQRIIEIVRPSEREKERSPSPDRTHFTKNEEGGPTLLPPRERRTSHSSHKSHLSHRSHKSHHEVLTVRGDSRLPPPKGTQDYAPHDPLSPGAEPGREEPPDKQMDVADPTGPGPIRLTVDGREVTIRSQVQLYCTNHQLTHPLVSPAMGYLGGLCPLLVIASDKEVLRDEIIYSAHKAARPDEFPLKEETRKIYPHMDGIEKRHGPTPVHLQVYDDTSHVLPLISFSTPAKYCYRAIAAFCVHVTPTGITMGSGSSSHPSSGMQSPPPASTSDGLPPNHRKPGMHVDIDGLPRILPESPMATTPEEEEDEWLHAKNEKAAPTVLVDSPETNSPKQFVQSPEAGPSRETSMGLPHTDGPLQAKPSELAAAAAAADISDLAINPSDLSAQPSAVADTAPAAARKTHFSKLLPQASKVRGDGRSFSFPAHLLRSMSLGQPDKPKTHNAHDEHVPRGPHSAPKQESKQATEDVAGPRFGALPEDSHDQVERKAGDPVVYQMKNLIVDNMIRERVSRIGTIRPLENPGDLAALNVPLDEIGVIKESAAKRYLHGQALWDKRFASTVRSVEKDRIKHLKKARKDADRQASVYITGKRNFQRTVNDEDASWGWSWALDGEEPPPSSIVARRDTHEARRLARIADKSWQEDTEDDKWTGNRLWTQLADWLTGPGERDSANDALFSEGESNQALEGLRRRGTIASTNGRELRPSDQNDVETPGPRPSEEHDGGHGRKSSLNPFSKASGSQDPDSDGPERKSSLNIFRHLNRKKGFTIGG
ncbi:alpha/beta-hydrolase [Calocera viscosa TUFC12733]|uniref:Alpha/beta-hydrolase n=1 Tax=Calocera viscosa (strain TUFC12733) TaxID=1330018 RepID=A0A167JU00_CALVF|nr:alpha/beta-hydrolase [Calocera viscosa TUFC12733]